MRVREDRIIFPNGTQGLYGVVEKTDFAVIAAFVGPKLLMVEQYRYQVQGRYWEFPQGSWEESEINPIDLAQAELEEETGYAAGRVECIGRFFSAYGFSTQGYDIFVARDLTKTETHLDPEEAGLISQTFEVAEIEQMILSGRIKDATTAAVFGLMKMKRII